MNTSLRLFALVLAWSIIAPVWSQFVIPDWRFRNWLIQIVPAAIDGDTLDIDHPDVLALTSMTVGSNCVNCLPPNPWDISGVEYFVNLEYLNISYCEIGAVQNLPNKIETLLMDYIPSLSSVDHWPDSARYISAKHDYYWDGPSYLQPIPSLPPYLEYLDLYAHLLDDLPPVPSTLIELRMDRNQLTEFPVLPNELRHLNIRGNLIPNIPDLPDSLRFLDVGGLNPFTSLPAFPPMLEQFHCTYIYTIQELPPFPPNIQVINTIGTNITCYPFVPPTVTTWNVATSLACIPNLPPFLASGNAASKPICNIINSSCPTTAAATGTIFLDENGNGELDPGELPLHQAWAIAEPDGNLGGSDLSGYYFLPLDTGTYTVSGGDVPWLIQTTPAHTVVITEPLQIDSLNHIGFQLLPGIVDLGIDLFRIYVPPRPGFTHRLKLIVSNVGTQLTDGTVTLQFDPMNEWVSASIAPTTQQGNNVTWSTGLLLPGQQFIVEVMLNTPASVAAGSILTHEANVICNDPDVHSENNGVGFTEVVLASFDPNDKTVEPDQLLPDQVEAGTPVIYTIRFQNTGTFMAERVILTDTLASDLQWHTLEVLDASHEHYWFMDSGVLHFVFDEINLPDSLSDEPGSHGHVRFSMIPNTELVVGESVVNVANIYFDYNQPVITEPSLLVVAAPTVNVQLKCFLGGPYDTNTGLMHDQLRAGGWLPLNEPYSGLGYLHVGDGGSETTTPAVFDVTGANAIVDWVVMELRDANSPSTVIATRSALIRRDGQIVAVDGVSPVAFNASEANYYVAIRHRNHLGCMTAMPITLGFIPTSIDLTVSSTPSWGTNARDNVSGTMVLWPGDVNFDGIVKYTGLGNDRDPVLVAIGGSVPTNMVNGEYAGEDVDMNGSTKYTGTDNDRDIILQTIGGVVPTAVRVEQVP